MEKIDKDETAEAAVKAKEKKNPDRVALIDKYLGVYPAARSIRQQLIADKTMDGGKLAGAVRKFLDRRIGQ